MKLRLTYIGLLCALAAQPNSALSAVYRCEQADGTFVFQQSACFSGHAPLDLAPLNTLGDKLRKSEQDWLKQRVKKARRRNAASPRFDSDSTRRRQAEKCLRKPQQLGAVKAKLRRGYKPAQGERLRRRRDDYAEYLRAFCGPS